MQVHIAGNEQRMIRTAIVGASGYSGAELMRLLSARGDVHVATVTANSAVGQPVDAVYPALTGRVEGTFEEFDPGRGLQVDLAFVALPSGQGMSVVPRLLAAGARVIDLGGDFRLKSAELYERYYAHTHTATDLLAESVYGLPELNADAIRRARLVANLAATRRAQSSACCPLSTMGSSGGRGSPSPQCRVSLVRDEARRWR
jgi:N-acetyl-gamma-glutamyl-phosphate reductase